MHRAESLRNLNPCHRVRLPFEVVDVCLQLEPDAEAAGRWIVSGSGAEVRLRWLRASGNGDVYFSVATISNLTSIGSSTAMAPPITDIGLIPKSVCSRRSSPEAVNSPGLVSIRVGTS